MPGLPIEITRRQASLTDSDLATAQTIEVMADQVRKAAHDPALAAAAADAVRRFRGGPLYWALRVDPLRNPAAVAESVWWAAKHALRFEHHEETIQVWFNERDQLQLLIAPDLLMRLGPTKGDCAIYTTLECAMLRAWGIPYEFVTVAADPFDPTLYGHVYCRAIMPDGARIVLDASHGAYPGWEVPREHTFRKAIWNADGDQIPDEGRKFKGLHAYVPPGSLARRVASSVPLSYPGMPLGTTTVSPIAVMPGPGFRRGVQPGFGRFGRRRGLGQTDTSTTVLNYPGIPDTSSGAFSGPGYSPPDITAVAVPVTGPGSGSASWASFIQGLSQQGLNLVGKVVAPTTTIQSGPGGTFIQTPAGSASALPASLTSGAGGGGSWLLIGGVLLAIVLIAGGRK